MTDNEKTKYCIDVLSKERGLFINDPNLIKYMRELPKDKVEIIDAFEKYTTFMESLDE
mgnify:CR=1 FL=1|jgi:hypothetical protein|tara:strand:+ start:223 stop:396 length:174 start_codon:yes stop_codon:yes gene_type:complete